MSGALLQLCPKRNFYFSKTALPEAGTNDIYVPVAERLDVSQWREATLMVRVHAIDIADSNDQIVVDVSPDGFTIEDPTVDYIGASVGSYTFRSTETAPGYKLVALDANFGNLVRVTVVGKRSSASSSSVVSLEATLSIALSLKD